MLHRRRGSLVSGSDSTCLVAGCLLPSVRRGGYCTHHTNAYTPASSSSGEKESYCFGHACQGQIQSGFCARHRQLADPGVLQSTGVIPASAVLSDQRKKLGKKTVSMVESQLGGEGKMGKGGQVLERFLNGLHNIFSEVEPHLASEQIIKEACSILEAERATLFYVDGDELVLMIAKGAKNIRLPKTKGIAGYVATTGHTVKIDDAYADDKFDKSFDASSGFRTRNIIATPVLDQQGRIIAVLQVINHLNGSFNDDSITLIEALAFHCSVSLRNAQIFEAQRKSENKISSLLEIIQMLHSNPSLNSLIFTLTSRTPSLVDADRCTLYLCDRARDQLVVMTGDVDIRIPLSVGIAGVCATSGRIINIADCYKDERFNQAIDRQTGYRTKSMLCMPIPGDSQGYHNVSSSTSSSPSSSPSSSSSSSSTSSGVQVSEVIGVLQVINRLDEEPFQPSDHAILATLLNIAGPILKKHEFTQKEKSSPNELAKTRVLKKPPKGYTPTIGDLPEMIGDQDEEL